MSKRILAVQLLLTALLMVCVCIPLGMDAAQHDQTLLALRTAASADAYAAEVKWRRLGADNPPLPDQSADAGSDDGSAYGGDGSGQAGGSGQADVIQPDDDLALYTPDGQLTASSGQPVPMTAAQVKLACEQRVAFAPTADNGHRQIVVTPVTTPTGVLRVLVVARSDHQTRVDIQTRWIRLLVGTLAAGLLALALSVLLARWVSRPLRRLERAAARLGDGELSARADRVGGPAEVRQLAASFDAMAGQIEELVDGQRAFLADVSHQIRTPLTAMRLRLELLGQDLAADPAAAGEVGGTLAEVHRLSRMVDGLLAMARTQALRGPSARVSVAVDRVVAGRVATWRPVAATAHVQLLDETPAGVRVLLTPGHLEQVLDNLLSNALEATPPGGRVIVRAGPAVPAGAAGTGAPGAGGRPPGRVDAPDAGGPAGRTRLIRLTVADDGPGMTAAARAVAFERFRMDRDVRADRRGHGLGLAVVHALAVADGGQVRLDEADGGGLLVVLDLPAAPAGPRLVAGLGDRAEVAAASAGGESARAG